MSLTNKLASDEVCFVHCPRQEEEKKAYFSSLDSNVVKCREFHRAHATLSFVRHAVSFSLPSDDDDDDGKTVLMPISCLLLASTRPPSSLQIGNVHTPLLVYCKDRAGSLYMEDEPVVSVCTEPVGVDHFLCVYYPNSK
eukprot:TRINITY_DN7499_c0_g4_i3.p1 TRINITY_DN7499_c0_g4~~TRINITY_DN7499_c0_g4_i3.p1  ORF type:complete len:139 (+),score=20.94 TRINITY_DN7499_c0_g4_i3:49-465(+)